MRKLLMCGVLLLLQAAVVWAQGSPVVTQQYGNGLGGGVHTYLIASTPADDGGDYDHLHLVTTFNCNDYAGCNSTLDATFGNRGGFLGVYTVKGAYSAQANVRLVAYRDSSNVAYIYLILANYYDLVTYTVLESIDDTVYSNPTDLGNVTPPGTLVFDTNNPAYPPANYTDFAGDFVTTGKIGVGTNAPLAQLNVQADGTFVNGSSGQLLITGATDPTKTLALGYDTTNGYGWVQSAHNYVGYTNLALNPGGGNVGIGTATPTQALQVGNCPVASIGGAAAAFCVNGGQVFTEDASGGTDGHLWDTFSTGGLLYFRAVNDTNVYATPWLEVARSGYGISSVMFPASNVGVGTTNPGAKLEVNGGIKLTQGTTAGLIFGDSTIQKTAYPGTTTALPSTLTASSLTSVGTVTTGTWNASPLTSAYLPTDVDYIDQAQTISGQKTFTSNVGIGTSTPQAKLDITGSLASFVNGTEDEFQLTRQINNGISYPQVAAFQLGTWNTSGACCGPQTRLDINLKANPDGNLIGETNVMSLLSNGNVGIGTTAPQAPLQVNGVIKANSLVVSSIVLPDGTITSSNFLGAGTSIPSADLPADVVYTDKPQTISSQTNFTASVGIGTNAPAGALDVNGVGGMIVTGANLDPRGYSLLPLQNTGKLMVGWNRSAGGGEIDLISNRQGGGSGGFNFYDYTNSGTLTPLASMDGSGNLNVPGNITLGYKQGGSITFQDGTTQNTAYIGTTCPTGGDYAESVDVAGSRTSYEPGDVMVIGLESDSDVAKSNEPYSTRVAGIYSTKPGVVGRRQTTDPKTTTTEIPMAMVGIVPTKVSAENGAILRGDLLVTASIPGYAMKGTDRMKMLGAVVGKAMGSLSSGTGVIEVLVTLQ